MMAMIIAVFAMALATLATRAFPFMLFAKRKPPEKIIAAARLIPAAVMLVLVFTSLPHDFLSPDAVQWIPWISVGSVAVLHLLFRHPMVSIVGGTALYMLLLNFFG